MLLRKTTLWCGRAHLRFLLIKIFKYQLLPCFVFLEASASCAMIHSHCSEHTALVCGGSQDLLLCVPLPQARGSQLIHCHVLAPEHKPWVPCVEHLWMLLPTVNLTFLKFCFKETQARECTAAVRQWTCPVAHRNDRRKSSRQANTPRGTSWFPVLQVEAIVAKKGH